VPATTGRPSFTAGLEMMMSCSNFENDPQGEPGAGSASNFARQATVCQPPWSASASIWPAGRSRLQALAFRARRHCIRGHPPTVPAGWRIEMRLFDCLKRLSGLNRKRNAVEPLENIAKRQ
jgi:hypothetical protein